MSDLDGGSAAPAPPDVPAEGRGVHPALACPSILDPNEYWVPAGCACVLRRGRDPEQPINVDDSACPIHSGVAGERSDSQIVPAVSLTHTPAPTPGIPAAAILGGGTLVSDEAMEAAARADHAHDRFPDEPVWDQLTDEQRDNYRIAARVILGPVAPLIIDAYLRTRLTAASAEPATEHHEAAVQEWLRVSTTRAAMVDALRTVAAGITTAAEVRPDDEGARIVGRGDEERAHGMQAAARLVLEYADELENRHASV